MQLNTLVATALMACMATAAPLSLEVRQFGGGGSSTASDIDSGKCSPVTLIFARGTSEGGNLGSVVGPALASGLKSKLGDVAVQGVDYAASVQGNASGGSDGGTEAVTDAQTILKSCPTTKIVLGGYSQGASVATYAGSRIDANSIAAVVLFGSPTGGAGARVGNLPASKILSQCASGDGVCEGGGFSISAAHLSYGSDGSIDKAVSFVASLVGGGAGAGAGAGAGTGTTAPPAESSAPAAGGAGGLGGLGGGAGAGAGGFGGLGGGATGGAGGFGGLGGGSGAGGLGGFGGAAGGSGTQPIAGAPTGGAGGAAGGLGGLGGLGGAGGATGGLGGLGGSTGSGGFGGLGGASGSGGFGGLGGSGGSSSGGLGSLGGGSGGFGGFGGASSGGAGGFGGLSGLRGKKGISGRN